MVNVSFAIRSSSPLRDLTAGPRLGDLRPPAIGGEGTPETATVGGDTTQPGPMESAGVVSDSAASRLRGVGTAGGGMYSLRPFPAELLVSCKPERM